MARANGGLGDWTFDAAAWGARTLGGIAPLRRALAGRMETRLRARAHRPASALRHPPAVEQDKAALALALLQMAERALAERRLGRPALRALLKTLFADVLVHRGDATAKERFRARHGCGAPDFLAISPGKACNLRCEGCYANSGEHGEKLRGHPALAARVRLPRVARAVRRDPRLDRTLPHPRPPRGLPAPRRSRWSRADRRGRARGAGRPRLARGPRAVRPRVPGSRRPGVGARVPALPRRPARKDAAVLRALTPPGG